MQKNIEIFNYSLKHPEKLLNSTYRKGELVITRTASKKNKLIIQNEDLVNLITSYKTLKNTLSKNQKLKIIDDIINLMFSTKEQMNYTAFSQYFMVRDLNYSLLKNEPLDKKRNLIKKLLDSYIKDRHSMYLSHGYSNIVLQVMSDNYSHKRNCSTGVKKVAKQLEKFKIQKYSSRNVKNFYLLIDKNKPTFKKILNARGINLQWSKKKQGKLPDILIQYKNKIYIIEHKHMKQGGGGQSKQDTEIVDIIRNAEPNTSFITYLDGVYFNKLINTGSSKRKNKIAKVKKDILNKLKKNRRNYYVNTTGFEKFIDDVVLA